MPEDPRPNPFKHMGEWYWRDEKGQTHVPFKHQRDALFDLLSWAYPDYQPKGLRAGLVNAVMFEAPFIVLLVVVLYWWFGK